MFRNQFNFEMPSESEIFMQKVRNFANSSIFYRGNNSSPFDSNQLVLNYY